MSNGPFLKHLKGLCRNEVLMELSWSKCINAKLKLWLLDVCFTLAPQDNDILLCLGSCVSCIR